MKKKGKYGIPSGVCSIGSTDTIRTDTHQDQVFHLQDNDFKRSLIHWKPCRRIPIRIWSTISRQCPKIIDALPLNHLNIYSFLFYLFIKLINTWSVVVVKAYVSMWMFINKTFYRAYTQSKQWGRVTQQYFAAIIKNEKNFIVWISFC